MGSIFDGGPAPYLCKLSQVMGVMNYTFLGTWRRLMIGTVKLDHYCLPATTFHAIS